MTQVPRLASCSALLGSVLLACSGTGSVAARPSDPWAPSIDAGGEAESGPGSLDGGAAIDATSPFEAGVHGDAGPGDAAVGDAEPADAAAGDAALTCGTGPVFFVPFATYPQLASVGGGVNLQAPGYSDSFCMEDYIVVLQPAAGQFLAFSGSSTDVCCQVLYQPPVLESACGHATYDLTGKCISSATLPPLTPLAVCSNGAGVGVTL